jgi:hypothetical protein
MLLLRDTQTDGVFISPRKYIVLYGDVYADGADVVADNAELFAEAPAEFTAATS